MQIRGYKIHGDIGQGGMATVYEAVQLSLNRRVALKVLAPALVADNEFCQRFLKEGKIVAQLSHPNIITIYDIGFSESSYFMSMEYLEGGNLRARIEQGLSENETISIVLQIAAALGYAHDSGFLHRDVKPHNVLFRSDGSAVLSDFGIAKYLGDAKNATQTGKTLGSPLYMSPEQIREEPLDIRTDLYSLGIVLYQMLTGFAPYLATTADSTTRMHLTCPLPKLPDHLGRFQPIIRRLLAKSRTNRFQNSWELIDAIQALPPSSMDSTIVGRVDVEQSSNEGAVRAAMPIPGSLTSTQRLSTPVDKPLKARALDASPAKSIVAAKIDSSPEPRRAPRALPVKSKSELSGKKDTARRNPMVPRLVAGLAMLGILTAVLLVAKQNQTDDGEVAENVSLSNTKAVGMEGTQPTGPLISLTDAPPEPTAQLAELDTSLADITDTVSATENLVAGSLNAEPNSERADNEALNRNDVVENVATDHAPDQTSVSLAQAQIQAALVAAANVEPLDQVTGLNDQALEESDLSGILEQPASMSKPLSLDIEAAQAALAVLADPGIELVEQQLEVTVAFENSLRQIIPQIYRDNLGQLMIDIDQLDLFQPGTDHLEDHGSLSLDRLSYVLRNYNGFAVDVSSDREPESTGGAVDISHLRALRVKQYLAGASGKAGRIVNSDQTRNLVSPGEGAIHLKIIPKL